MPDIPRIFTPEDIRALQRGLKADILATDEAVKACSSLSPTLRASWNDFRDNVMGYATVTVNGFGQLNYLSSAMAVLFPESLLRTIWGNSTETYFQTGKAFEIQLVNWQKAIRDNGCALAVIHEIPKEDEESTLVKLAKLGGILAIAAVGAYGLSVVTPVLIEGVAALKASRRVKSQEKKT